MRKERTLTIQKELLLYWMSFGLRGRSEERTQFIVLNATINDKMKQMHVRYSKFAVSSLKVLLWQHRSFSFIVHRTLDLFNSYSSLWALGGEGASGRGMSGVRCQNTNCVHLLESGMKKRRGSCKNNAFLHLNRLACMKMMGIFLFPSCLENEPRVDRSLSNDFCFDQFNWDAAAASFVSYQ